MRSKMAQKILDETPQEVKDKVREYGDKKVAMSEAEKKWKEWAMARVNPTNPIVAGSITFGIRAYKEALRSAIEERVTLHHRNSINTIGEENFRSNHFIVEAAEILSLLDSVTPKE